MSIPEFILRTLFVENSLCNKDGEFQFQLCNKFLQIQILTIAIRLDDQIVQEDSVSVCIENIEQISASRISEEEPFLFPVGAVATIRVRSEKADFRKITIATKTREVGMLEFSVRLHPNTFLEKVRSFLIGKRRSKGDKVESRSMQSIDWERLENDALKWFNNELERPLLHVQTWGQQINEIISINAHRKDLNEILDRQDEQLRNMRYHLDAYPKFWPNFGPGVVASFLGSHQITAEDTAWFMPIDAPFALDSNRVLNKSWEHVKMTTRLAIVKWGDAVSTGYTDLGGNLDILASLWGTENLLFRLSDSPETIDKDAQRISEIWSSCFKQLTNEIKRLSNHTCCWGALLFPGSGYYLQSDFAYMISPKMFERFVLPDLETCCREMEYPFYHMDGTGQLKHLDILLAIKDLKGIQWVPGEGQPPPEEWLQVLGKIRKADKLVQVGTSVQGARKIVAALGSHGFCFEILQNCSEAESKDIAKIVS